MKKTESTIIKIPNKEFENKKILRYATCFGLSQQSLFLTTKENTAKVIFPDKESQIYINNYCADGPNETYYDSKNDRLILQSSFAKVNTKYWDLRPIVEEFKKQDRVK